LTAVTLKNEWLGLLDVADLEPEARYGGFAYEPFTDDSREYASSPAVVARARPSGLRPRPRPGAGQEVAEDFRAVGLEDGRWTGDSPGNRPGRGRGARYGLHSTAAGKCQAEHGYAWQTDAQAGPLGPATRGGEHADVLADKELGRRTRVDDENVDGDVLLSCVRPKASAHTNWEKGEVVGVPHLKGDVRHTLLGDERPRHSDLSSLPVDADRLPRRHRRGEAKRDRTRAAPAIQHTHSGLQIREEERTLPRRGPTGQLRVEGGPWT
jgi:hypothetical protein